MTIKGSSIFNDPWAELVNRRDEIHLEEDVHEFLKTKRKATKWKMAVQVVCNPKSYPSVHHIIPHTNYTLSMRVFFRPGLMTADVE
jgi:hypothetical protein